MADGSRPKCRCQRPAVADDRHGRVAGAAHLAGHERAPSGGLNPEQGEQVVRHQLAPRPLDGARRLSAVSGGLRHGERQRLRRAGGHALKAVEASHQPVVDVGKRRVDVALERRAELHEAMRLAGTGNRRQQHGVDPAEDRGVDADAKRQHQHRRHGEGRRVTKRPGCVAQVRHDLRHRRGRFGRRDAGRRPPRPRCQPRLAPVPAARSPQAPARGDVVKALFQVAGQPFVPAPRGAEAQQEAGAPRRTGTLSATIGHQGPEPAGWHPATARAAARAPRRRA